MGLNLGGTPVTSNNTKERIQRGLEILEDIQEQMAGMGLTEYPKPKTTPEPLGDLDLSAMENRELEGLMAKYTGYAAYVGTKLAEAEVAYKVSTAAMKAVSASLKVSLYKDGSPKTEIDAKIQVAPEYIEYELEHLKLYATKEILDAHYKAYSRSAQAVSRTIEVRKLEYEQDARQHSVGGFKGRPSTGGLPARGIRRP